MSTAFSIKIEFAEEDHLNWIEPFTETYSKYVDVELGTQASYPDYCAITLTSTNYTLIQQLANYICTRIQTSTYMDDCLDLAGSMYWLLYIDRIITMISKKLSQNIINSLFGNKSKVSKK